MLLPVTKLALLLFLTGCATPAPEAEKPQTAYAGVVQKVYRVVRPTGGIPVLDRLGKLGTVLGPALRSSTETHQYVVRTEKGQILAQSDDEFAVGDCVEVRPQSEGAFGPAFRYGEAQVVRSERCSATSHGGEERTRFGLRGDPTPQRTNRAL